VKTISWTTHGESFTEFTAFDIQPIIYDEGIIVDQGVLSYWNDQIKEEFKLQNLQLTNDPRDRNGVLIVKSIILTYEYKVISVLYLQGSRNGVMRCTIRTTLVNKSTGNVVGEIVTDKETGTLIAIDQRITPSGLDEGAKWNLKKSAEAVAKEVANIIHTDESNIPADESK
jgi:hypothetical protein